MDKKVTNRFFTYLVFEDLDGNTLVKHRTEKGIWQNLFQFPLIEEFEEKSSEASMSLIENFTFKNKQAKEVTVINEEYVKHKLSHQDLHIRFYKLSFDCELKGAESIEKIKEYPFPIVLHNFIETNFL